MAAGGPAARPDAQRQAIGKFASENDLDLVGEYCDYHSGWRKSEARRPEFQRLMANAAEGRFDVVLVFHTSRFARSQVESRRYKQLLREYYSVSLSFWTRSGLKEKARQGHLVGTLPWGSIRAPDCGLPIPDPEKAQLARGLFERYATGNESDRSLAAWLNAKGARTPASASSARTRSARCSATPPTPVTSAALIVRLLSRRNMR